MAFHHGFLAQFLAKPLSLRGAKRRGNPYLSNKKGGRVVRDEKKYEKTLTLRMSNEEHQAIKMLAIKKGLAIKDLLFYLLEKENPDWRNLKIK